MMISPDSYVRQFEKATYRELMEERARLIQYISQFEQNEIEGIRPLREWQRMPSPDTIYQVYLKYLAKLCELMRQR